MTTTFSQPVWNQQKILARKFTTLASSLRVPVTVANREYLRVVRQAELDAWRNAPGGTLCVNRKR